MEEYSYFQFHYIEGSRAKKGWYWAGLGLGAGLGVITSSNSFNNSRKSKSYWPVIISRFFIFII